MRVRSAKDGAVYAAIQPADPLLYDPADVPALLAPPYNIYACYLTLPRW